MYNSQHTRLTEEALYLRGVAYMQQGRLGDASVALEEYVRLSPEGRYAASAHQRLAELYTDLGLPAKRDENAAKYEELR